MKKASTLHGKDKRNAYKRLFVWAIITSVPFTCGEY